RPRWAGGRRELGHRHRGTARPDPGPGAAHGARCGGPGVGARAARPGRGRAHAARALRGAAQVKIRLVVDVPDPEARWAAEVLLSVTGLAWSREPGDGPLVHVVPPGPAKGDVVLPWTGLVPAWSPPQLALGTFEGVPV